MMHLISFMSLEILQYTTASMSDSCTVVIGEAKLLDALRERAGTNGEVLAFRDSEALAALETITARRPQFITLERLFAATSRGAALINRIKADPSLVSTEIRVMSHDGVYSRVSPRRTAPGPSAHTSTAASPAAPGAALLDYRGTRRAERFRMSDGSELQIDGAWATLVDLATMGAQIISKAALRPLQRVRVSLSDDVDAVRFNAAVSWASFEIPKGDTQYRAGIEFLDAQAGAVEAFIKRHQS
jgi:hypothetical protein